MPSRLSSLNTELLLLLKEQGELDAKLRQAELGQTEFELRLELARHEKKYHDLTPIDVGMAVDNKCRREKEVKDAQEAVKQNRLKISDLMIEINACISDAVTA